MTALPPYLMRHTVTLEPLTGEGPFGPLFGPSAPVRCRRDDKRRLVRGRDGSEIVSETTLYMSPQQECPDGSRITLDDGRVTTVILAARRGGGRMPTPDHLEVNLT